MKIIPTIAFTCILVLTTGCPGTSHKSNVAKLQENGMDLPDLGKTYFDGVNFKLSGLFEMDTEDSYVLSENSATYIAYGLNIHFSIEKFDTKQSDVIKYTFEEEVEALDAVHLNYIEKRKKSLIHPNESVKKSLPKSSPYNGYIQTIIEAKSSDYEGTAYFLASIKIDDDIYVIQLIGKDPNMGYLYDDFLDILNSIEKA